MIASNKKQEKAIEDNAKTADFYIGKIDELSKKEHRNAGEKKLLANYVDELNKLYPDLNLTYDENTDTLSKNTDEIKKNIEKLNILCRADLESASGYIAEKLTCCLDDAYSRCDWVAGEVGFVDEALRVEYYGDRD